MKAIDEAFQAFHEDEGGHVEVGLASLLAGIGAIVLAIGAAGDSDVAAYIGGAVLGLGILGGGFLRHRTIDYDVYARLEKLEGKK